MNAAGEALFQAATILAVAGGAVAVWHRLTVRRPELAPRTFFQAMHPRRLREAARRIPAIGWGLVAGLGLLALLDSLGVALFNWHWSSEVAHQEATVRGSAGTEAMLERALRQIRYSLTYAPFQASMRGMTIDWSLASSGPKVLVGGAVLLIGLKRCRSELLRRITELSWSPSKRAVLVVVAVLLLPSSIAWLVAQIAGLFQAWYVGPGWGLLHWLALPFGILVYACSIAAVHGALRLRLVEGETPWPRVLDGLGRRSGRVVLAFLFLEIGLLPGTLWPYWTVGDGSAESSVAYWVMRYGPVPFAWLRPLVIFAALEADRPVGAIRDLLTRRPAELLGTLLLAGLFVNLVGLTFNVVGWSTPSDSIAHRILFNHLKLALMLPFSLVALALWIPWFAEAFRADRDADAPGGLSPAPPGSGV